MPVFNERKTVEQAIDQVLNADLPPDLELVIVDDGSTDGSAQILDETAAAAKNGNGRIKVVHHDVNRGKGAAVRTALQHATGTYSAIFDADLEYDPADLKPLLEPLEQGTSNAAFGVRAFNGYSSHSFLFVLGNRGVTLVANVLFNVYLRDIMTCHKVIETDLFRSLQLTARGFDIEPEIAARLVQRKERIYEVPVHYRARATEEGKKLTAVDGLRVVRMLLRCRFSGA
jgi:glycosyltransferase involved in cell wall biosynthesis